jgi:hypothetical protein
MKTFKEFLSESPLYNDKELDIPLKIRHPLNNKSMEHLKESFKFFTNVDFLQIWFDEKTFLVGQPYRDEDDEELFSIGMIIRTRGNTMFPTTPSDIIPGKNSFQVSWAEISTDFANVGIARKVYLKIIEMVGSLTSDNEQYKGAKRLWKSLARNVTVNVWDGNIESYIKDDNGSLLTLRSIDDSKVWGKTPNYRNVLLVARNVSSMR